MKNAQNYSLIIIATLLYTSCAPKSEVQIDSKTPPPIEEAKKPAELPVDEAINPLTVGGQPGVLTLTGVAVKKDGAIDHRISILAKGGTGKIRNNKTASAELIPESQPMLSPESEKIDLSNEIQLKNVIAIGCDEAMAQSIAKEKGSELSPLPKPVTEQLLSVRARTVVLCGNLDQMNLPYVSLTADEIILNQVQYTKSGSIGGLRLLMNKLSLIGKSTLEVNGGDTEITYNATAPSLELHVMKEIQADKEGHLSLRSIGASYKAPTKKD